MKRASGRRGFLFGCVAVLAIGFGVAHAAAPDASTSQTPEAISEPPPPKASAEPAHKATAEEDPLSATADRLYELSGSSFSGIEVDPDRNHIVGHWAGEVPSAARAYAESKPNGVTIELVTDGRFSRARLVAAMTRINESALGDKAGVEAIAAKWDGSGLEIDLAASLPDARTRSRIASLAGLPEDAIRYVPNNPMVLL